MKTRLSAAALCGVLIWISGCSTTPTEPPKSEAPAPQQTQIKQFKEAEKLYRQKKYPQAAKKFYAFAKAHPNTSLTDDAYYYLGVMASEQNDHSRASQYFTLIVDGSIATQYFDQAVVSAASSKMNLGQIDDALKTIKRFRPTEQTNPNLALRAYDLSARLRLQKNDPVGAIQDYLSAMSYAKTPEAQRPYLGSATEIIYGNLTEGQLEDVLSSARFTAVQDAARFRLGVINFEKKNWSSARRDFSRVVENVPGSALAERARQYLSGLEAQQTADVRTIGVVLPLSGKLSQLGYKTLRGIQMALGIYNSSSPFRLAVVDSEGNPDLARRGVERLVTEDHVVAIIGDVQAKTAQAVAIKAQEFGVPCITLSQKTDLIDVGDFIFRSTLTADMQMKALVNMAMKSKGMKRFAIIYPNDQYGTEYATAFWDYVLLNGGKVTAVQTYDPRETDFRHVIRRLVGTYYADEDRAKEFKRRLEDWKKNQKSVSARDKVPNDLMPPIHDFDAIFIPDNPKTTGQIAAMLAYNDVPPLPLLGTNLWNTPQIVERGGKAVEGALFVDSFFSQTQNREMKKFSSDFEKIFGYSPDVFESQGYDAAALVANLLRTRSIGSRLDLRTEIAKAEGISGSTSTINVSMTREVEKTLIPLTISGGKIVEYKTGR